VNGEQDRLARVVLSRVMEPGDPRVNGLVSEIGSRRTLEALLAQDHDDLVREAARTLAACDPGRELERAAALGVRFVTPEDDEWPAGLDGLRHTTSLHGRGGVPVGLWVNGPLRLDRLGQQVAVVGCRSSTTYGDQLAWEIASDCGRAGVNVVSGAAFGIDQAAHRGALAAGGTSVAVLACGADRVYPAAHTDLLRHLSSTCAVVSEAAPGLAPLRVRFLSRNRLIAALSGGTVVVEASTRSGARNTASWAGKLHRPVMGVPGPVTSAASSGVHEMLRDGSAVPVVNGAQVLEMVGESGQHLFAEARAPERPRDRLDSRHRQVLEAVPAVRPAPTDSIATTAGLGLLAARTSLHRLAELGLVVEEPHGWRLAGDAR
jgi:DNA processing protein